jgi:glutaredoxin
VKVYRICEHCNKEFVLSFASLLGESINTMQDCPYCNKQNDIWIRITSEGDSQESVEAVEQSLTQGKTPKTTRYAEIAAILDKYFVFINSDCSEIGVKDIKELHGALRQLLLP